jgi:DNA-binding IclR family transcriptional regulator
MDNVKVKSLSKALNILECFSVDKPELGITELCDMLGLFKSNVHNIVTTFEQHGFLTKNPQTSKYRLGLNILKLSNIISSNLHERDFILPHIKRIANETEEMVYYGILHKRLLLYLDFACTSGTIIEKSKMGVTAPLYCTATGKAIMAYLPEEELEEIFQDGFHKFTERTITDKESMLIELEHIRQRGYSVDTMEHEYGIKGVGIPILNNKGYPIAAISVSGPSLRFDKEKIQFFAGLLKEHRNAIAQQLQ